MTETPAFAVYLYPQAVEALGGPVKPYLQDGADGAHFVCTSIDVSGPFFGLILPGRRPDGRATELEIMIPHAMVRLVMSIHNEHDFGFA